MLGLVIVSGLVFGSFASALIYRIPRDIPWIWQKKGDREAQACRSACPHCGYQLRVHDLVPVLSWLLLGGKCRACRAPISAMYPLAEILTVLGFLCVYSHFGVDLFSIPFYLLVPVLVALLFIDLEHFILPDELVAAAGVLGATCLGLTVWGDAAGADLHTTLIEYAGGALIYGGFAWAIGALMGYMLKKDALGFGDVKFFAVAGLWLGLSKLSYFTIGAGVIGVVFALLWRFMGRGEVFPFGPALILSFFAVLFL